MTADFSTGNDTHGGAGGYQKYVRSVCSLF